MYREICTHKGNLKNLLLEGIDDQAIIQSLVAVSKKVTAQYSFQPYLLNGV